MRDKKLCYYYDEKYESRHKCKRRQIYLVEGEEDGEMIVENDELEGHDEDPIVLVYAIVRAISH